MAFTELSQELQNILLLNHNYMTKWFVFLTIVFLSSYYVWYVWPEHKPTRYITQAILRFMLYGISIVYIASSPMMIILMTPEYAFLDWYLLPLKIYSIIMSILGILFFVDFIRLGFFYVLGKAGLDLQDDRISDMINDIENNKHFLNMKKKGDIKFGK